MKRNILIQRALMAFLFVVGLSTLNACDGDETTEPTPATGTAPSALVYSPNNVTVDVNTGAKSEAPTIEGSTPITYTMTSSPDASGLIIIDNATGVVSVTNRASAGSYVITVTAKNDFGSMTFDSALTIDIVDVKQKINFADDIQPVTMASCSPCHAYGGSEKNYVSSFDNVKTDIDKIIDRINRDKGAGGFMPQGGNKLAQETLDLIEQWKTDGLLEK